MKWRRARFKDAEVWASVDETGAPVVQGGRVPIRYSKRAGAKTYRAGASRVTVISDAPVETLEEGAPHEKRPSRRKKSGETGPVPEGATLAYTDGACSGNPGPAGAGALVELPDGRRGEASLSLGNGTNNIGELAAIGLALDLLEEAGAVPTAPVVVYSDSSYARGVLTQGWKAKKNTALIYGLRERLAAWPGVQLRWVKGHSGNPGNERADALARDGALGRTVTEWVSRG